jgi:hypothetical protein
MESLSCAAHMTFLDEDEKRRHLSQIQIHGITCTVPVELPVAGRRDRSRWPRIEGAVKAGLPTI